MFPKSIATTQTIIIDKLRVWSCFKKLKAIIVKTELAINEDVVNMILTMELLEIILALSKSLFLKIIMNTDIIMLVKRIAEDTTPYINERKIAFDASPILSLNWRFEPTPIVISCVKVAQYKKSIKLVKNLAFIRFLWIIRIFIMLLLCS
jgi:hypothetical protein